MIDPKEILRFYDINPDAYSIKPLGTGLIHKTYVVLNGFEEPAFVLQEVNTQVFTRPMDIAQNLQVLENYRKKFYPDYLLPVPMPGMHRMPMAIVDGCWYRLTSFVHGSSAFDRCDGPERAFEAARQFGRFTAVFSGMSMEMLRYTIPGFHHLPRRWEQFQIADKESGESPASDIRERWSRAASLRALAHAHDNIVERYEQLVGQQVLQKRVTHHDTKISNVLFNAAGKGLCVIDLDTVMPGYFISDVGDMMRTYLPTVTEEETDLDRIQVRPEIFDAIRDGYLEPMASTLTATEIQCFSFAGEFMIYMQALRFLTDYLQMDRYYGQAYEEQNFNRAANQFRLLELYQELLRERESR